MAAENNNNLKTIVGTRVCEGKNGKYQLIYYSENFTDYDKETSKAYEGVKVGQEYSKTVYPNLKPGDKVKFYYEKGFQDKAFLDFVKVEIPAKQ